MQHPAWPRAWRGHRASPTHTLPHAPHPARLRRDPTWERGRAACGRRPPRPPHAPGCGGSAGLRDVGLRGARAAPGSHPGGSFLGQWLLGAQTPAADVPVQSHVASTHFLLPTAHGCSREWARSGGRTSSRGDGQRRRPLLLHPAAPSGLRGPASLCVARTRVVAPTLLPWFLCPQRSPSRAGGLMRSGHLLALPVLETG